MIDLDAERDRVTAYRHAWAVERAALDRLLVECAAAHHTPPANYWEAERRAAVKLAMAERVMAVLDA